MCYDVKHDLFVVYVEHAVIESRWDTIRRFTRDITRRFPCTHSTVSEDSLKKTNQGQTGGGDSYPAFEVQSVHRMFICAPRLRLCLHYRQTIGIASLNKTERQ